MMALWKPYKEEILRCSGFPDLLGLLILVPVVGLAYVVYWANPALYHDNA